MKLLSIEEAARIAEVDPITISMWRDRDAVEFRSLIVPTSSGEFIRESSFRMYVQEQISLRRFCPASQIKAISDLSDLWSRLEFHRPAVERHCASWPRSYFDRIAGPYRSLMVEYARKAEVTISASGELLKPFGEPLTHVDESFLRCVFREHENSFSDWLAYILSHMECGEIERILGITAFLSEEERHGIPMDVKRESWVKSGHEKKSGLLDILVVCSESHKKVFCIETKMGTAEESVTKKQLGYYDSLTRLGFEPRCILLVMHSSEQEVHKFKVLLWRNLTIGLRRWVAERCRKHLVPHTFLALVLAFVACVERKVLGLSANGANTSMETIEYLNDFIKTNT